MKPSCHAFSSIVTSHFGARIYLLLAKVSLIFFRAFTLRHELIAWLEDISAFTAILARVFGARPVVLLANVAGETGRTGANGSTTVGRAHPTVVARVAMGKKMTGIPSLSCLSRLLNLLILNYINR